MPEPRVFKQRQSNNAAIYHGTLPQIDRNRIIAVYVRQSKTGADDKNGESRETQLGLQTYAMLLRNEENDDFVRLYDEGAGVSGQKRIDERPELDKLYRDISKGEIGTVIVAREDRLFRDKHGQQSGTFTEAAERHSVVVIVPPIASDETKLYNFSNYEHLKDFREKMKAAYDYIHYHIGYMHKNKQKKADRGEYDGRSLPPGLTVKPKEQDKEQRPVIYEPWAKVIRKFALRAKELNWNIAKLNREVSGMIFLFPELTKEDQEKYIFKTTMGYIPGVGYKPHHQSTIKGWFTNVMLIGWWPPKEDEDEVIIENHPAILDRDLFEEGYAHLTGYMLNGEPATIAKTSITRTRKTREEPQEALFHERLLVSPPSPSRKAFSSVYDQLLSKRKVPYYQGLSRREDGMAADKLFSVPVSDFDTIIVNRLKQLANVDSNIADRIKKGLEQIRSTQEEDFVSIYDQLSGIEKQLTSNTKKRLAIDAEDPLFPFLSQEAKELQARKVELEHKKGRLRIVDSPKEIAEFFDVLSDFEHEYPSLLPAKKQKLFSLLINRIEVRVISPHWLRISVRWLDALSARPDIALLWRNNPINVGPYTEEEIAIIKKHYASILRLDMLKLIPNRTWSGIQSYAQTTLNLHRELIDLEPFPKHACYLDLIPFNNGQFLFMERDTTLKIIKEACANTQRSKDSLYAIWILPENLEDLAGVSTSNIIQSA